MRAVLVTDRTGPAGVHVRDVPTPRPHPDHVLVEVRAAGVTFPDLLLAYGRYQEVPELPFVLGGEFAGVVLDAPSGSAFTPGDRVVCSSYTGFAEQASVPCGRVLPLPDDITFEDGACLPANYLTMMFGLGRRGRMQAGERVLVHGASGGVGTASIQLALALGASQVVAVTSSPLPIVDARLHVVPVEGFAARTKSLTEGHGVDVVVDPVGGDRIVQSLSCMAPGGRALVLGFASGTIPTIDVGLTLEHQVDLVGVGWGAYLVNQPETLREEWDSLVSLMREHPRLRPVIDRILTLDDAADALRALEDRRARGRLVLRP
ncbi:NADPH:quinone oxidoreductase family protein [Mumia zhuanghuii]|uniref:NADPH:quinone oxidoreductase family protein n=2 Tax=Mumia TaxID=1546255 RepID=A0ABW1QJI7_9ACTN|nr:MULTISPECIES: NADPH:quinone oxidoreductase family protein [Mumia]KAA1423033.1 NADPH:quinone oxidoreductase family protein [Mumia zhuanghuii]